MNAPPPITPDLPVGHILSEWPETIPVFIRLGVSCVGCYLSSFDTLEDALAIHNLPLEESLAILNQQVFVTAELSRKKANR